jgi:hypothetical protein
MRPTSTRVPEATLERVGSTEGLVEMVLKFFIREVSCLKTTPDQVSTRLGLGDKGIKKCSKSPTDSITNHRVADLSTDHERYVH